MKAILILFLSTTLIFSTSFTTKHDFYVSITEIEHDKKTEALELSFIIFTDDLEKGIEEEGTEKLQLGTDKEHKKTDTYIERYLKKYFSLKTDDAAKSITYIGKEVGINRTYLYAEISNIPNFKEITVTNKILFNLHDGQKNIVHVKKNGKKKSMFLYGNKSTSSIKF